MPTTSAIASAVKGLRLAGNLTPELVPTVTFSPTLGMVAARIDKLGLDIRSFKVPLTRAIRDVMVPSIRKNFAEQGRPESWTPLSDSTIAMRSYFGYESGPILDRTGLLKRTASQINIWDISETSAVIRDLPDKIWYGKVQQGGYEGGSMAALVKKHGGDIAAANEAHTQSLLNGTQNTIGAASIPARPFLVFQDEDDDKIREVFMVWLAERVELSWGGL